MAGREIIDLTVSPPYHSPATKNGKKISSHSSGNYHDRFDRGMEDDSSKKFPRRKVDSHGHDRKELEHRRRHRGTQDNDTWKHDKYVDDDSPREKHKRKREKQDERYDSNKRGKRNQPNGSNDSTKRGRSRSPTPVFTVDVIGSADLAFGTSGVPSSLAIVDDTSGNQLKNPLVDHNGLLLPSNVSVAIEDISLPSEAIDIDGPMSPISDASGIDFVDDDRTVGAPRYFQDSTSFIKSTRMCKNCGDEEHVGMRCPNIICLTCGARNEHTSRSCPALRFCFGCYGKGHLSRDCPRIGSSIRQRPGEACERCGSYRHHGSNCPTLWRIYTYLSDAEREAVLADRESKRKLGFDHGGEGYIAHDHWCYNCGNSGHLGDDCENKAVIHNKPDEVSAFGISNQLTGPFASLSLDVSPVHRKPRHWETDERFDDGHGFSVELNVGRKGREKAKKKAREAQRRVQEANDDEPDWFDANCAVDKKKKPKRKKSSTSRPKSPNAVEPPIVYTPMPKSEDPPVPPPRWAPPPAWVPLPSSPSRRRTPTAINVDNSHSLSSGQSAPNLPSKPMGPQLPLKPSLFDHIDMEDEASFRSSEDRNHPSKDRSYWSRGRDRSPRDPDHRQGRDTGRGYDREWNSRRDEYRDEGRDRSQGTYRQEQGSRWKGGYDRY